jgi:hypothetical protein
MATGTINGKFYENIPTPEEWGAAQADNESLRASNKALLEALEAVVNEADYDGCNSCRHLRDEARDAIKKERP